VVALRNELEEAQDDAQDTQKMLEEANVEVDQLKQELEHRRGVVDHETNVTERVMLQTQVPIEHEETNSEICIPLPSTILVLSRPRSCWWVTQQYHA
jgi:chromosome segregation ATPase